MFVPRCFAVGPRVTNKALGEISGHLVDRKDVAEASLVQAFESPACVEWEGAANGASNFDGVGACLGGEAVWGGRVGVNGGVIVWGGCAPDNCGYGVVFVERDYLASKVRGTAGVELDVMVRRAIIRGDAFSPGDYAVANAV